MFLIRAIAYVVSIIFYMMVVPALWLLNPLLSSIARADQVQPTGEEPLDYGPDDPGLDVDGVLE